MYQQNKDIADSYEIPDYDLNTIKEIKGGVIALIGGTGTGKTFMLRDILHHVHSNYKTITLMSGTAILQTDYDFFPRSKITNEYKEDMMQDIWEKAYNTEKEKRTKQLIILDDVVNDKEFINSKTLKKIACGGRHLLITVIVLSQYLMTLRPIIRENIRLLITFETDSFKERKKIIEEFLAFDNPKVGNLIHKRITEVPYQVIVVAVYKKDHRGKIFKYIAAERPGLKINDPDEDRKPRETKPRRIKVDNNEEIISVLINKI